MEKGASWQAQPGRKLAATVQGLEAVRVPAGAFKAWKIEYVWTGGSGTEYSYRAWFSMNFRGSDSFCSRWSTDGSSVFWLLLTEEGERKIEAYISKNDLWTKVLPPLR